MHKKRLMAWCRCYCGIYKFIWCFKILHLGRNLNKRFILTCIEIIVHLLWPSFSAVVPNLLLATPRRSNSKIMILPPLPSHSVTHISSWRKPNRTLTITINFTFFLTCERAELSVTNVFLMLLYKCNDVKPIHLYAKKVLLFFSNIAKGQTRVL